MKRRILATAASLFAENGYDATGVQELSEAVGLGRGALYHHIGSKERLLYEISIRHVTAMIAFGEELVELEMPADEKFRTLARRLMSIIAENLSEITVFFHEYRSLSPEHNAEMARIRDRFEAVWGRILQEGHEAGIFNTAHPMLVKGILGLYNYSYVWLRPGGELGAEEIADMFSDMAIRGLRT